MTIAVVLAIVAVVVVLVVITRQSSRVKKEAKADLEREIESLKHYDIMELVAEEAAEIGVDAVDGGEGISIPVKLRVWHRDASVRGDLPPSALRFVVDHGIAPENADEHHVRLEVASAPDSPPEPPADTPADPS